MSVDSQTLNKPRGTADYLYRNNDNTVLPFTLNGSQPFTPSEINNLRSEGKLFPVYYFTNHGEFKKAMIFNRLLDNGNVILVEEASNSLVISEIEPSKLVNPSEKIEYQFSENSNTKSPKIEVAKAEAIVFLKRRDYTTGFYVDENNTLHRVGIIKASSDNKELLIGWLETDPTTNTEVLKTKTIESSKLNGNVVKNLIQIPKDIEPEIKREANIAIDTDFNNIRRNLLNTKRELQKGPLNISGDNFPRINTNFYRSYFGNEVFLEIFSNRTKLFCTSNKITEIINPFNGKTLEIANIKDETWLIISEKILERIATDPYQNTVQPTIETQAPQQQSFPQAPTQPQPQPQPQIPQQDQPQQPTITNWGKLGVEVNEFSLGIKSDVDKDGNWYSRGFTGVYDNNTFEGLGVFPSEIQKAISNKEFEFSNTANMPAIVTRVVEGGDVIHNITAAITTGYDEHQRPFSAKRFTVTSQPKVTQKRDARVTGPLNAGREMNPFIKGKTVQEFINNLPVRIDLPQEIEAYITPLIDSFDGNPIILDPNKFINYNSTIINADNLSKQEPNHIENIVKEIARRISEKHGVYPNFATNVDSGENLHGLAVILPANNKSFQILNKIADKYSDLKNSEDINPEEVKRLIKGLINQASRSKPLPDKDIKALIELMDTGNLEQYLVDRLMERALQNRFYIPEYIGKYALAEALGIALSDAENYRKGIDKDLKYKTQYQTLLNSFKGIKPSN